MVACSTFPAVRSGACGRFPLSASAALNFGHGGQALRKPTNQRNSMKPTNHNSNWTRPALALGLLLNALAFGAGPAHLTPLLQGKWPGFTSGNAYDVKVVGNRAYLALREGGLAVLDVSNPASPVRLGGYDTSGFANGVAVSGTVAYVTDGD